MGILDRFRRDREPRFTLEQAAGILAAKMHPLLADGAAPGRTYTFGDGVRELDQNFRAYLESVGLFPWIMACVDAIGAAAGALPIKLYSGDEEVDEHPLLDLLNDPNPDQGWHAFAESIFQQLGLTGEAYIVGVGPMEEMPFAQGIGRRPDDEVWVVPSHGMAPVLDKGRVRVGRTSSPVVRWVYDADGVRQSFTPEQVIQIRRPHPRDPIRGLSPLKKLERALNQLYAAETAEKEYLANGAFPGLVISSERTPDPDMAKAFQEKFRVSHEGAKNMGRALWLWGSGIAVERMKDGPKDAMFSQTVAAAVQQILAVYKVPPFVVGLLEHANWSNSNEQQRFFYQQAVMPAMALLLDTLNSSPFVQAHGDGLWLAADYSGVDALQPNRKEAADRAVALYKGRLLTKNEARAEAGLGPVDDESGDEFAAEAPAGLAGLFGPDGGEDRDQDQEDEPTATEEERARAFWALVRRARREAGSGKPDNARALRWKAHVLRSQPLENAWAREWRRLLRELRDVVLEAVDEEFAVAASGNGAEVTKAADDPIPSGLPDPFSPVSVAREWLDRLRTLAKRTFLRGAEDTLEEVTDEAVPFPANDSRLADYIDRTLASKIRTIAENRLTEVQDIVREAAAEGGLTVGDLHNRLRDHFDRNNSAWSKRIARTETAGLYNRGALAGLEDAGVELKEWLSARDADVRESHSEMDGMAIPLAADFVFEGGAGPAPGLIGVAEEDINCRCALVAGFGEGGS